MLHVSLRRVSVNPRASLATIRDLPGSVASQLVDGLLNIFFPEQCLVCTAPLARRVQRGVCDGCWKKALQLRMVHPWCPSCGLPFQQPEDTPDHLCGSCGLQLPPFSGARSFGYYTLELRRILHALKFHGRKELSFLLSPLLALTFISSWPRQEVDVIVPVPLHPKRKRERGFNQSAVLGRKLGRLLVLPCCESALRRVRSTLPQVGLTDAERFRNVSKAFHCQNPAVISGKRVLLLDDVMTTGATVSSASQALLAAGAFRVSVLTVARAVRGVE